MKFNLNPNFSVHCENEYSVFVPGDVPNVFLNIDPYAFALIWSFIGFEDLNLNSFPKVFQENKHSFLNVLGLIFNTGSKKLMQNVIYDIALNNEGGLVNAKTQLGALKFSENSIVIQQALVGSVPTDFVKLAYDIDF